METSAIEGGSVLEAVAALAARAASSARPDAQQVADDQAFLSAYYAGVDPADLAARAPADLYCAAMAHRRAGARRPPGTPVVHAYDPEPPVDGWASPHTVIDIVTDDMPFLVDSVTMVLAERGIGIHAIAHPLIDVERSPAGELTLLRPGATGEAWIHLEVDRCPSPTALTDLQRAVRRALDDVRTVVEDWPAMHERALELAAETERATPAAVTGAQDAADLLRWMAADQFTFLGYREYELAVEDGHEVLRGCAGTGLGLLGDEHHRPSSRRLDQAAPEVRTKVHEPNLLVVTKASSRSTVHRPDFLAYVGVKRVDATGRVVGERRFIGLWGAATYRSSTAEIPILHRKVAASLDRSGLAPDSHSGRELWNILETYPRDELFQITVDELLTTALSIINLQERRHLRLFARRDDYGRFVSCLIYVPRDRYSSTVVERMKDILLEAYGGTFAEYDSEITASVLARLHVVVFVGNGSPRPVRTADVERQLAAVTRWWLDDLRDALIAECGEQDGLTTFALHEGAFPAGYREAFTAANAVEDITRIASVAGGSVVTALRDGSDGGVRFELYTAEPVSLSAVVPVLEELGAQVSDERPFELHLAGGQRVWLYDFGLQTPGVALSVGDRVGAQFLAAFDAVWRGDVENDGFNRLVLSAGLPVEDVRFVRAYAKYLRQTGTAFSQPYIEATLAAHPALAGKLVDLFRVRFTPDFDGNRALEADGVAAEIVAALDEVASLDEDRIIRSFLRLIQATTRTNAFRRDHGGSRPFLSFKLDPEQLPELPAPRPRFEVWAYAPHFEAVHLRGGAVARGGIRWSDRREDFRTEILGLMKAQMVKNAVIVPTGAKGGFVVKRPPASGDPVALREEVVRCYRDFMRALLDVTDNIVAGAVVPPPDVVRHDGDDPYLVVAADKGTATFSDIANDVAAEYGFWLGDAFASGGSAGYDHKAIGITARGAWESVRRHLRHFGLDADRSEITVVGIGDMSGDVFGNGMLLSHHLKLVAAFDHRHVFVDPDPDPERSWAERRRLFELPRSSWDDYDRTVLSPGGGIWPRSAKAITLSDEARDRLGVVAATFTPSELISAILAAPVDLLWNGGIGSYVKASTESNADVADRANDSVRIDATALRVRAVAEGGNLGFTQRARVEYALQGGYINTDAIDNSAGVDTSDHEVNSKVLLNAAVADESLTMEERNDLLQAVTDDVAELVLADNKGQNLALALARSLAPSMIDEHGRYIRALERTARLSRSLEALPTGKQLAERQSAGLGLTSPELAVLLSDAKIELVDALLASDVVDDPFVQPALAAYFPPALSARFAAYLPEHRLRRPIIATALVNEMVNRCGPTFAFRMAEETGASAPDIVRAYLAAAHVFDVEHPWQVLDELDVETAVPADTQLALLLALSRLIELGAQWLLRNRRPPLAIAATVQAFQPGVTALAEAWPGVVSREVASSMTSATRSAIAANVPAVLAASAATWPSLANALDIIEVARARGRTPADAARVYWGLFDRLDLEWLWERINVLPRADRWQEQAQVAAGEDLLVELRTLADDALRAGDVFTPLAETIDRWMAANERTVAQVQDVLGQIRAGGVFDLTTLSVALRQLRNLVMSSTPM